MTADPAAVLAGLIAEATPGPWAMDGGGHITHGNTYLLAKLNRKGTETADAALIVHLVNLAPTVVDLITAAEEVARIYDGHSDAHDTLSAALGALTVTPEGEGPAPT